MKTIDLTGRKFPYFILLVFKIICKSAQIQFDQLKLKTFLSQIKAHIIKVNPRFAGKTPPKTNAQISQISCKISAFYFLFYIVFRNTVFLYFLNAFESEKQTLESLNPNPNAKYLVGRCFAVFASVNFDDVNRSEKLF